MVREFPLLARCMRAILMLTVAALGLAGGCATDASDPAGASAAQTAGGTVVQVRTLRSGSQSAAVPEKARPVLVRRSDDYPGTWEATVGHAHELPGVDFQSEAVVVLLAGSKPTGGWGIDVRGARLEGRTLVIDAPVKAPPPDAIVTQAFTSPFAVIAVKSTAFDDVRWNP
jgi:hypothetical protein